MDSPKSLYSSEIRAFCRFGCTLKTNYGASRVRLEYPRINAISSLPQLPRLFKVTESELIPDFDLLFGVRTDLHPYVQNAGDAAPKRSFLSIFWNMDQSFCIV